MTSIVELFPKSRKLAYDARQQLSLLQNNTLHATELFLSLEELTRQLDLMEYQLLQRETPAQRTMWRRKIHELRQDAASIRNQGEYYVKVVGRGQRYENERDELMAVRRRRRGNDSNSESDQIMNELTDASDSLTSSHNMISEIIASGQATLGGLVEQRQRLKGVKRVLLDMGSKIGLSNATMRMVERRDVTDMYLVGGGMVVTLGVLYLCFFWRR